MMKEIANMAENIDERVQKRAINATERMTIMQKLEEYQDVTRNFYVIQNRLPSQKPNWNTTVKKKIIL